MTRILLKNYHNYEKKKERRHRLLLNEVVGRSLRLLTHWHSNRQIDTSSPPVKLKMAFYIKDDGVNHTCTIQVLSMMNDSVHGSFIWLSPRQIITAWDSEGVTCFCSNTNENPFASARFFFVGLYSCSDDSRLAVEFFHVCDMWATLFQKSYMGNIVEKSSRVVVMLSCKLDIAV